MLTEQPRSSQEGRSPSLMRPISLVPRLVRRLLPAAERHKGWRRASERLPIRCADGLVVLELPSSLASVRFRVYQEHLCGSSVLTWVLERFAALMDEGSAFAVLAAGRELERVRAVLPEGCSVLLQPLTSRGQLCDLCDVSRRAEAEWLVLVDLTAALLPAEVWRRLFRQHAGMGNHATILGGVPCSEAPVLVERRFLTALARRRQSANRDLRSAVRIWADHANGRLRQMAVGVNIARPVGPEEAGTRRWPYRVRLELPEDVEVLREAVGEPEAEGMGVRRTAEPLDHWPERRVRLEDRGVENSLSRIQRISKTEALPRVLYAQVPSGLSGVERVVTLLAGDVAQNYRERWRCNALVGFAGTFTDRLAQSGVDVQIASGDFAIPTVEAFAYCRGVLEAMDPDLVHAHTRVGVPFCCAIAEFGVCFLQHVHVADEQNLHVLEEQLRLASHVIAVSQFVKRRVLRMGVAPDRVRVIHNGMQHGGTLLGGNRGDSPTHVRRQMGLPEQSRLVLLPARFARNKRHDVAVDAFGAMRRSGSQAHLLLVGDTQATHWPLVKSLQHRVRKQRLGNRVHFLGFREDMDRLYAAADALLLPSEDEPFGLVLLEAMAAGVPVVASRSGGIPEIVEHGKSGLLVEPGDVDGFADALRQVLTERELRDRLVEGGRVRCETHFSLTRFVDQVLEVYEEVLGTKGAGASSSGTERSTSASLHPHSGLP